jgi:hypothetical protein
MSIVLENVKFWADSKDLFLINLAKDLVGKELFEIEEDLTEILLFFSIFSLGCREAKLEDLADKYKWRSDTFIIGLKQLGLKSGSYKIYVTNKTIPGPIGRIIYKASNRAAYRMVELNRYLKVEEIENEKKPNKKKK